MILLIKIVHIVACFLLVLIILTQVGKGASLAGLFGGGSQEAIFSGAGGNVFLKRLTLVCAIIFAITSLSLTVISSKQPIKTIMQKVTPLPVPPR